jgi:parallel beta-helix repeat protein
LKKLISIFIYLLLVIPSQAGTIYVDANATGANNGSSWADAYKYLQDALTAAGSGSEIRVAQGTYWPDEDADHPAGTDNRDATFQLENGVAIYGGFPTGGGSRDPNTYKTILSGDIGVADNNSDNSYHVVTGSGTYSAAILDGFTVTAGNANGSSFRRYGAGMYNFPGSPTITNCTFVGSSAVYGGGMYNRDHSNPTVTNCTFSGNSASEGGGMRNDYFSGPTLTNCTFIGNLASNGGGMDNSSSSPTLTNCTFSSNSATYGGGMRNVSSNSTLTNCTFSGNSASGGGVGFGGGMNNDSSSPNITSCTFSGNSADSGGGMFSKNNSSPTLTNCTFSGNSASDSGGGILQSYGSPVITNCTFSGNSGYEGAGIGLNSSSTPIITNCTFNGNSAVRYGGGVDSSGNSSPTLTNCIFSGNSGWYGVGMYLWKSSPTVTNCTFSKNFTTLPSSYGGAIYNRTSNSTFANCIFWGNTAINGAQIYNYSGTLTVSYSDIQDGWAGTANINADPLFVDANGPDNIAGTEDDNLRLSFGSPCIDDGNNSAVPAGVVTDLDGHPRKMDGDCNGAVVVDMGAFEFNSVYFGDFDSDCDVGFYDYAVLAASWLQNDPLTDIAPTPAGDGVVDTSDLAVLCDNWLEIF